MTKGFWWLGGGGRRAIIFGLHIQHMGLELLLLNLIFHHSNVCTNSTFVDRFLQRHYKSSMLSPVKDTCPVTVAQNFPLVKDWRLWCSIFAVLFFLHLCFCVPGNKSAAIILWFISTLLCSPFQNNISYICSSIQGQRWKIASYTFSLSLNHKTISHAFLSQPWFPHPNKWGCPSDFCFAIYGLQN